MAGNRTGCLYSIMTFGESHGPFIGVVIDGVKPGLAIDMAQLQLQLDRRRPGQSGVTSPRSEKDRARIVSGVFEGKTTGTPICILIENEDQRSADYDRLKNIFRPGHASFTYLQKYGIFDYRGGGRASGRETATRVAAGAIARQILAQYGIRLCGFVRQVGPIQAQAVDYEFIDRNPVRCCDPSAAKQMEALIHQVADAGDSIGGVVELHISGLPSGLGDPVFEKLDAELSHALMSIGAVKGIEFGNGFRSALMRGSENNDVFHQDTNGRIVPKTNHAGGILGGISTGQELILRIVVKPPSSINKEQTTVDHTGDPVRLSIGGRHDPCICPRVVPVAEATAALAVLDLLLVQQAICEEDRSAEMMDRDIAQTDVQLLLLLERRQRLVKARSALPGKSYGTTDLAQSANTLGLNPKWVARIWELLDNGASHQGPPMEEKVCK